MIISVQLSVIFKVHLRVEINVRVTRHKISSEDSLKCPKCHYSVMKKCGDPITYIDNDEANNNNFWFMNFL